MPWLTGHVQPEELAYPGFQRLDHPPYSPDLVPLDYHLFPGLKKELKGRHFSSDEEVIAAAETRLDPPPLHTLEQRAKICIELRGEYEFGRCSLFPSWSG
jgi:histone-lysine N-methyltransferase SETMAR